MLLKISHGFDLQICKKLLGSNQNELHSLSLRLSHVA